MSENKNGFVEFFSNDMLMTITMVVAVLSSVVQSWMNLLILSLFSSFTYFVNAVCIVVVYVSYKKHDKNVMKGMMGAIFMLMLLRQAESFTSYLGNIAQPKIFSLAAMALLFILILILMVNHFIINADRHSKPWNVKFNQIIFICLLILEVVYRMALIINSESKFLRLSYLVSIVTVVATLCILICIETKLEGYKAYREANGWVETPYSGEAKEMNSEEQVNG